MLILQEQGKSLGEMLIALCGAHVTAGKKDLVCLNTHNKIISIQYEALPIGSLSEQQV